MTVKTTPKTKEKESSQPKLDRPWLVILYNDDIHTFDEVIRQLQKATGCSQDRCVEIALEAHFKGKAVAYKGSFRNCNHVTNVLREIGLIVEIQG